MNKIREILKDLILPDKNRESSMENLYGERLDQAEAEIEVEFQRRLAEKIDMEKIKKIIFDFLFNLQLVEIGNISFYAEALTQVIAQEIDKVKYTETCPNCKSPHINTDGGDCFCAECGHKWSY